MYARVLSKAFGWMAMRLYMMAEGFMRRSQAVDSDSRDDAALSGTGNGLQGSPPAHWLEMVRRHAPELYRSVVARRVSAAGRPPPPGTRDMNALTDTLRVQSIGSGRMPKSTLRPMPSQAPAPDRGGQEAGRQQAPRAVPAAATSPASTEMPGAKQDTCIPRQQQVEARATPQCGTTDTLQPAFPHAQDAASIPPSRPELSPATPHFDTGRAPSANRVPAMPLPQQPSGSGVFRKAAGSRRVRETRDTCVAGTSRAAPVFPGQSARPSDGPAASPRMREAVTVPDPERSMAVRSLEMPTQPDAVSRVSSGSAELHRFQAASAVITQPAASPRWATLPDPVVEAGTDVRWAALPDDGWTQPLPAGTHAGRQADDGLQASGRYLFDERSDSAWNG